MSWLLLILYWCIGIVLLYKTPTLQIGSSRWVSPLFWTLKILIGFFYGWIHLTYYGGGDTFAYFELGKTLNGIYYEKSSLFFQLMFTPVGGIIAANDQVLVDSLAYWNSGGNFNMIRVNALFHFISFGNYWEHVVLYSCFSFLGFLLSFRILERFSSMHKTWLAALCFSLPSLLFWSSGFHKDGFVFLGLVLIIHGLLSFQSKKNPLTISSILVGFFLVALFRNFILIPVIPMIVHYIYSAYKGAVEIRKTLLFILGLGLLGILGLFFFTEPFVQLLEARKAIQALQVGGAEINPVLIGNSFLDLVSSIPQAFMNGFFQPFLGMGTSSYFLFFESTFLFFGLIYSLFTLKKEASTLGLFLLFIAVFNIVIIGWVVDNAGTIIRYRSVYFALIWMLFLIRIGQEDVMNLLKLPKQD